MAKFMKNNYRRREFHRNEKLEILLSEINGILEPAENRAIEKYRMPRYPVVLIVGCGRSGTTLMLQWLARSGNFSYPSNFLSRFYIAPYIGAKIQDLLTNPVFNFRDELVDLVPEPDYRSDLGKTRGSLAPNEFWYFWRRFFPYEEIQFLDNDHLASVDSKRFVSELAALESAFEKPLALKAMIINFNIAFVSSILDKALFIHVVREPLYNAQSLLEARESFFGTTEIWYSFKPVQYNSLKSMEPCAQVAGQVYFTNQNIDAGMQQIPRSRRLTVHYEDFCKDPALVFDAIKRKFNEQEVVTDWVYRGPSAFTNQNILRIKTSTANKILHAYQTFLSQGEN
jgi:hypothetical protein